MLTSTHLRGIVLANQHPLLQEPLDHFPSALQYGVPNVGPAWDQKSELEHVGGTQMAPLQTWFRGPAASPLPKPQFSNIQTRETERKKYKTRQKEPTYLLEHLGMSLLNLRKINCAFEAQLEEGDFSA